MIEFWADGLRENLGVGMVSRLCSPISATSFPVPVNTRIFPATSESQEFSIPAYSVEAVACRPAKTFPDKPCGSHMSGRRLWSRLSNPPNSPRTLGNNAGWLGTWDNCPLLIDPTSWNSLESLIQFTSFCNSCSLAVSSLIVSWFSINSLLENSSTRNSWALFNSSISWRLLIRVPHTLY